MITAIHNAYCLQQWFFRSESGVFLFVGLQPCRGVDIMKRPIWKSTYK